jgi:hypothetical protein
LDAEDRLILLYLGQFFFQIPYLFFELLDHFSSGLATLTHVTSSALETFSVWE